MTTLLFRNTSMALSLGVFAWISCPAQAETPSNKPLVAVEYAPREIVNSQLIDNPVGGGAVALESVPFVGKWASASSPIQFYTFTADSPSSGKMTVKIGKGKSKTVTYKNLNRKSSVFFVDGKEHFYTLNDDGTELKLESENGSIRLFRED